MAGNEVLSGPYKQREVLGWCCSSGVDHLLTCTQAKSNQQHGGSRNSKIIMILNTYLFEGGLTDPQKIKHTISFIMLAPQTETQSQ